MEEHLPEEENIFHVHAHRVSRPRSCRNHRHSIYPSRKAFRFAQGGSLRGSTGLSTAFSEPRRTWGAQTWISAARVRSSDASGSLVVGTDYSLTTAIPVTVALSPQSATIAANGTQQFTATVANDPNHAVFWSATAGTVSSSGLFTAPNVS
jgi:hypothetical protein